MDSVNRRAFVAASLGAASSLGVGGTARAATCVTGGLPGFLPAYLTVDCASRYNFRLFRKYAGNMGLAAVVNMTYVKNKWGGFEAGNLFLFPWLNAKGLAQTGKVWGSVMPVNTTQAISAEPIKGTALPVDEYFCRTIMQMKPQFIGCIVDAPYGVLEARFAWFANAKLADGEMVGIDWTSSNLNHPWFGGSQTIPDSATCNGAQWRKLIVDALSRASTSAC
jgi:hypothetical protein